MGSSLTTSQWLLLAVASGLLYLLFDAARFFVYQIGPVRLRSWTDHSEDGQRDVRWFRYDSVEFSLISGAVLQLGLVAAVGCTAGSMAHLGPLRAVVLSILTWGAIVLLWKYLLAFVSESVAEKLLRGLLPLSHVTYFLLWPLLAPLSWLYGHLTKLREIEEEEEEATEEEVQAYIDVGEEEGIFEKGEGRLVQSIVDFGDRLAHEVMTPRVDVFGFDVNRSVEDLANCFSDSKYSRIPIFDQSIDQIVGVVHVKDVFESFLRKDGKSVRDLTRPAYFVPESKLVAELLKEMQLEHQQIAIVLDEFGGTAGIITIEDLIEEIVGEIADEHEEDVEDPLVQIGDDAYLVHGLLRIERLEEAFGMEIPGEGFETVGGLIFTTTGRVPPAGEIVNRGGLRFEVERADRKRIHRVRVSRDPEWNAEEAEEANGRTNGRYERTRS